MRKLLIATAAIGALAFGGHAYAGSASVAAVERWHVHWCDRLWHHGSRHLSERAAKRQWHLWQLRLVSPCSTTAAPSTPAWVRA